MGVGMAVLQQIGGNGTGTEYAVSAAVTVFGRHDSCGISIPSPAVSRHHFQITNDGTHYFIEDLNSRNGTLLNGKPLRLRMLLVNGDRIEVSSMAFKFLTRDSLSEVSGSWGVRAEVISLTRGPVATGGDDSARRQTVDRGDLISVEELGSDAFVYGKPADANVTFANATDEGAQVIVRWDPKNPPKPGDTITVEAVKGSVHLFNSTTGERI